MCKSCKSLGWTASGFVSFNALLDPSEDLEILGDALDVVSELSILLICGALSVCGVGTALSEPTRVINATKSEVPAVVKQLPYTDNVSNTRSPHHKCKTR
jgi:hypothetical protein